ncbi:MAG: hypothetical protein JWO44_662 [Bacteroidetes bacterium]|nr:hypothetical protein [Bacteroidota bacterium]
MYEGPLNYGMFKGTVIFYYDSGKIKKTETYDIENIQYCNSTFAWTDVPYETGTWRYYSKSGRLFKQKEFLTLFKNNNDTTSLYRISILSRIDKKGNIKTKKTEFLDKIAG